MNQIPHGNKKTSIITCGAVEEITGSKMQIVLDLVFSDDQLIINLEAGKHQWSAAYKNDLPSTLLTPHVIIVSHLHVDHVGDLVHDVVSSKFHWPILMSNFSQEWILTIMNDWFKIDQMNQTQKNRNNNNFLNVYWECYNLLQAHGVYSADEEVKAFTKKYIGVNHWKYSNFYHQSFRFRDKDIQSVDDMEHTLSRSYNFIKYHKWKSVWDLAKDLHDSIDNIGYTEADIVKTLWQVKGLSYEYEHTIYHKLDEKITVSLLNAGHSLGSSQVFIQHYLRDVVYKSYLCSGDVGRINDPFILSQPTMLSDYKKDVKINFLAMEATYGNRVREETVESQKAFLCKIINEWTWDIIDPAFSYQRGQDIGYLIHEMIDEWLLPDFGHGDVEMDGGLLNSFTNHFARHEDTSIINPQYNRPYQKLLERNNSTQSKWKRKIIIPSWWMLQWWASLHYLWYLDDPKATFIFPWFQAPGTRWYDVLKNKDKYAARIEYLSWLSGHADQVDLMDYFWDLYDNKLITPQTHTLLRHGDPVAKHSLARLLSWAYELNPHKLRIPVSDNEQIKI